MWDGPPFAPSLPPSLPPSLLTLRWGSVTSRVCGITKWETCLQQGQERTFAMSWLRGREGGREGGGEGGQRERLLAARAGTDVSCVLATREGGREG